MNITHLLRTLLLAVAVAAATTGGAQERLHIHTNYRSEHWDFPVTSDSIGYVDVSGDRQQLLVHLNGGVTVPFSIGSVDSVTVAEDPFEETKDPYQVFQLYITTNDGSDVTSRDEYADCHLSLQAKGSFSNYSGMAGIRGRGNSTFLWYAKKPYRIRLEKKHKILGLDKARSWVLLANYRDVTDLMNTFVFEMGRWLGMPFTNHTRYAEVFLNGDYRGLYQLTEQVQQGKNRVDIGDEGGILLTLDVDDGPGQDPYAGNNFWTDVFRMPAAVKYPDDEHRTAQTVDSVRTVFATLEQAIKSQDYSLVEQLLDVPLFIKYLLLQELVYNVELSAPRSVFLFKDGDGKWQMGPLWDFDAGFDFDWSDMYTGHTFFTDYRETVMGTNPVKRNGQYPDVSQFFTNLFGCKEFVEQYKAQWNAVKDSIITRNWDECMKYVANLRRGALEREDRRWPVAGKNFETELEKMHQWLLNRADFMTTLIDNIPVPGGAVTDEKLCGTVSVNVTMDWTTGYSQTNKVKVSKQRVLRLMGLEESAFDERQVSIVPLMNDGSDGPNGTNGVFGGWFDEDGEPGAYANGHVYIEVFQDLWNWNCGLYQENCYDDAHDVVMQYQYPHNGQVLKVNVKVHFTLENIGQGGGWWW